MTRKITVAVIVFFSLVMGVAACRQNSDNPVRIERIKFREASRTLQVGEEVTIGIDVEPANAKKVGKVAYSVSQPGIVEINETASGNDGVVFTATAPGTTVIMAKSGSIIDYCDINVSGYGENIIPYISVSSPVLEIPVGQKRNIIANIQGGNQGDNAGFVWYCLQSDTIQLDASGNVGVVEGLQRGSGKVRISHPKAQYNVEVLVFVLGVDETAKYITADENVVVMFKNEEKEYIVSLVGCDPADKNRMMWEVVEGLGVVTISPSGDSCRLKATQTGIAAVRVTNPAVEYPFEFQVVVNEHTESRYIDIDENLIIINNDETRSIVCRFTGTVANDVYDKYSYTLSEQQIINVQQVQNVFNIKPLKIGSTILTIHNEYSDFPREVLVIVEKQETAILSKYITTSQNVIYMEVDGEAALTMSLLGGNEADKDGFSWEVSDYTIIEAQTGHGRINYRSMYVDTDSRFNAQAFLKAKKVGTAVITVTHDKAEYDCTVLVKVYRKGTFNHNMVTVGAGGLVTTYVGGESNVSLSLLSGRYENLGDINWVIEDTNKAAVAGSELYGVVSGKNKGVTKLTVNGSNLFERYESLVVVNEDELTDDIPYMYVERAMQRLYVGQTVAVQIQHPNIPLNEFDVTLLNPAGNVVYAVVSRDVVILNALSEGTSEIKISGKDGLYANDITLYVTVEGENIDPDRPYRLSGDNFLGMVLGDTAEYTVSLTGADAREDKGIVWSIDDTGIASVSGNGRSARLQALAVGQTVMSIEHSKSSNVKKVIVYTVATPNDLGKIVIGAEKTNYIINSGETIFIKLITNATEDQKKNLRWSLDNFDVVEAQDNYDSAVITAIGFGTVKIQVWELNGNHVLPLDIYITVRDKNAVKDIGLPSSVALIVGETKVIRPQMAGISEAEMDLVEWGLEEPVVSLINNRSEIIITGLVRGQTFINVSYDAIGLYKKILVVCAETAEELEQTYWFSVDKGLYRINENEEIVINLIFGQTGFPPDMKNQIHWENISNNDVVDVMGGGQRGTIVGRNEGVAIIRISSDYAIKTVDITVEVNKTWRDGSARFLYNAMYVIDMSATIDIPVSMVIGKDDTDHLELETGYNFITLNNEDSSIANASIIGRIVRVQPRAQGRTVLTLKHPDIQEDARITIVVSNDADTLQVAVRKTHWLIDKNSSITLELETNHADSARLQQITWTVDRQDIVSVQEESKTKAVVTAKNEGSAVVSIAVGGIVQVRIFIGVMSGRQTANYSVATESIIRVAAGEYYYTNLMVSGNSDRRFNWTSDNPDIASVEGINRTGIIYGKQPGHTELYVNDGMVSRTLLVFVRDTKEELEQIKALNIDRRNFRIGVNETVVIQPYYQLVKPLSNAQYTLLYDNGVIERKQEGQKLEITGRHEGIEVIRIANAQCDNTVDIVVEVTAAGAELGANKNMVYMTTEQNVVLMNLNDSDALIRIQTIGEYQGNIGHFAWSKSNNNVALSAFGNYALVSALGKQGETVITVKNPFCDNELSILVNVSNKYVSKEYTEPYIWTAKSVYTALLDEGTILINYELRNVGAMDIGYDGIMVHSTGNAARIMDVRDGVIVMGISSIGITELTISHADRRVVNNPKITVIVNSTGENSAVYLTTGQNYVIVPKMGNKIIQVNLNGFNELNPDTVTWRSENNKIAYVVGSGFMVQVHGVNTGITNIYAKHERALNSNQELKIVIKVVEEGSNEQASYLTTAQNVIETYVSSLNNQISVNKVGGTNSGSTVIWNVDDPAVVSVTGTGLSAYFTAKKEGVARITVTDSEAGTLEIVIIVRNAKPGTEYIVTSEPVIMVQPGSGGKQIEVGLAGGVEQDNKDFEWQIYEQVPGDLYVAQAGGSVIALFANGNTASMNGLYPGKARIRVRHPKANDVLYIAVLVTDYNVLSFTENNKIMLKEDNEFTALNIPNYENLIDRVVVETSNADIVKVTRAGKMLLLSSGRSGNALITATIAHTDLRAELPVIVEDKVNENDIIISMAKTLVTFNPYSSPEYLNAQLLGNGLTASASDELKWTIKDDGNSYVTMIPSSGLGREVQIAPVKGDLYANPRFIRIEVSDSLGRTERTKSVIVYISQQGNNFTLNKSSLKIETGKVEMVECIIAGGSGRDYDDVQWYLERDQIDPYKQTVQLMGSGKSVQLFGVADGLVNLVAIYRGIMVKCQISIESPQYFAITYEVYRLYPGEKKDGIKDFWRIPYIIRPRDGNIRWYIDDTAVDPKVEWFVEDPKLNDNGYYEGYINVKPVREGTVIITGQAFGMVSSVDIIITYNFLANFTPMRLSDVNLSNAANGVGEQTAIYKVFPPSSFIRLEDDAYWNEQGLNVTVNDPDSTTGIGTVKLRYLNEVFNEGNVNDKYVTLTFKQYIREASQNKESGKYAELKVMAMYNNADQRIVPVFQRVFGHYSNKDISSDDDRSYTGLQNPYAGKSPSKGSMYNAGEYLKWSGHQTHTDNKNNNYSGGDNETYEMTIGDGEEHYIMFDPIKINSFISIDEIDSTSINTRTNKNENRGVSVEELWNEKNEIVGIRLSGGKDFVVYSNVGSYWDMQIELSTERSNTGEKQVFDPNITIKSNGNSASSLMTKLYNTNVGTKTIAFVEKYGTFYITHEGKIYETSCVLGDTKYYGSVILPAEYNYKTGSSQDNTVYLGNGYTPKTNTIRLMEISAESNLSPTHFESMGTTYSACSPFYYVEAGEWNVKVDNVVNTNGQKITNLNSLDGEVRGAYFYPNYPLIAHGMIGMHYYDWGVAETTTWRPLLAGRDKYDANKSYSFVKSKNINSGIPKPANLNDNGNKIILEFGYGDNWGTVKSKKEKDIKFDSQSFKAFVRRNGRSIPFTRYNTFDTIRGKSADEVFGYEHDVFDYAIYSNSSGLKDLHIMNFYEGKAYSWDIGDNPDVDRPKNGEGVNIAPAVVVRDKKIKRSETPSDKNKLLIGNSILTAWLKLTHDFRIDGGMDNSYLKDFYKKYSGADDTSGLNGRPYLQDKEVYLQFNFKGFVRNNSWTDNEFPVSGVEAFRNPPFGFYLNINNKGEEKPEKIKQVSPFDYRTLKVDEELITPENITPSYDLYDTNVFFPVATEAFGKVRDDRSYGRIGIKYKTARGYKYVYIDVHYEVRPCTAAYDPVYPNQFYVKAPAYGDEYIRDISDKELLDEFNIRLRRDQWNQSGYGMADWDKARNKEFKYQIDVDY